MLIPDDSTQLQPPLDREGKLQNISSVVSQNSRPHVLESLV